MRLFGVYAVASLVPVLVLGFALAGSYQADAQERGLAEARAQAGLLARTAIQPALDSADLEQGLDARQVATLHGVGADAVASDQVIRFRIRDLRARVVFSSDGSGTDADADEEALDAARGRTVAHVTRLDADAGDGTGHDAGERVAEVYWPLTRTTGTPRSARSTASARIGVLEIYLPYDPIARDVSQGLGSLYRDLALGLGALYVLLALISWSVTQRLRRQIVRTTYLAEHDTLTGLPNRALFGRHLDRALRAAAAGGPAVAVALIDLDRFKEVNDTLGHGNGDELLRELGRRLAASVRRDDTVARLGGDEFGLVLVGDHGADEVLRVLHRLRVMLEQEAEVSGLPLTPEASIGFAMAPEDGRDAETLLQQADIAMYVAKAGTPTIVRYDRAHDHYDSTKLALVAELRRAIRDDELVLHYQPKASIASGEILAVEALVRWQHPERGLLFPDAFLPIAEQTGIIDALTGWVVNAALRELVAWGPELGGLALAVNVSARNVCRPEFAASVIDALTIAGVAPERLLLEMTETALVTDPERAGLTLRALAAAGVRISLDDFGRGQTSLGYLSTLPLHEVKIDKSFVSDMTGDRSHAAIVKSVIDLAENLGFHVVAEGVEDEPTLVALTDLHCDVAQGYLIARPMPSDGLLAWLDRYPLRPGPLAPAARAGAGVHGSSPSG